MLDFLDNGLIVLIGGFLIHLVLGSIYLWGNINIYVTSYLWMEGNNVTLNDLFFVLPLSLFMLTIFSALGPFLLKYFNPKLILLSGGTLLLASYLAASYVTSVALFIILYGVFAGIGTGICYLVPVACIWEYFPERKGCAGGIVIGGFGLSAFIFSFIVQSLFNPLNLSPDQPGGYFGL